MLGTARLLGQSSGAALVALMLNQFGDNGTHVSLIAAAILAVIAACVSGLRITQPRSGHKKSASIRTRFLVFTSYYFRYSPVRRASIRLSSGGWVMNNSLSDFDLPLMQKAIMLVASCGS